MPISDLRDFTTPKTFVPKVTLIVLLGELFAFHPHCQSSLGKISEEGDLPLMFSVVGPVICGNIDHNRREETEKVNTLQIQLKIFLFSSFLYIIIL